MRLFLFSLLAVAELLVAVPVSRSKSLPNLWWREARDLTAHQWGKLSAYWAQEAIGAPEGHRFMAMLAQRQFPFRQPQIGLYTSSGSLVEGVLADRVSSEFKAYLAEQLTDRHRYLQDNHHLWYTDEYNEVVELWRQRAKGNDHELAVINLLLGEPPTGISRQGVLAAEVEVNYQDLGEGVALQLLCGPTGKLDLINYSSFFSKVETLYAIAQLSKQGNVLHVMSAGNDYPRTLATNNDEQLQAIADNLITVGSCSPAGCISRFSRAGKHLTIVAPSDHFIQTARSDPEQPTTFAGTSGATPLVSGALADVLSILPSLTAAEAQQLLQKTAIPTAVSDEDGGGVVNYYKLLRVAYRVNLMTNGDISRQRQLINDDSSYDFHHEALIKLREAEQASDSGNYLSALREAFFLDPDNSEVRDKLSSFYWQSGYYAQAMFYSTPDDSLLEERAIKTELDYRRLLASVTQIEVLTDDGLFSPAFKQLISFAVDHPEIQVLLEMLLDKIKNSNYRGNLMVDLQLDAVLLAQQKPTVFEALKNIQLRQ